MVVLAQDFRANKTLLRRLLTCHRVGGYTIKKSNKLLKLNKCYMLTGSNDCRASKPTDLTDISHPHLTQSLN